MCLCTQIANPDEFDVMIAIPVGRVNIEPFGDDGAFYRVALKRGNSPLKKFQEKDTLSASEMLQEFREEVKKSVKEFTGGDQNDTLWQNAASFSVIKLATPKFDFTKAYTVAVMLRSLFVLSEWEVTRKKKGCPAVTLVTKVESLISLDVVLSLKVEKSSWPCFTNEGFKIESWLGAKVKQEYKRQPYYLVPKYEGWGAVVKDGVLAKGESNKN